MKGVGSSSAERLHTGVGPNQWEMVAMDYVDLNDLVPQVFFFFWVFFSSIYNACRWMTHDWRVIMKESR